MVSVQRQELDGRAIVVIEVPQGSDAPYSYKNVIYLRDGHQQVASSEAIREMVLASNVEPIRWERRHSLADLDSELDVNEIRETVEDAQKLGGACSLFKSAKRAACRPRSGSPMTGLASP